MDAGAAPQHVRRSAAVQPAEHERRQTGRLERADVSLARAEEDHDPLGVEPPRDEEESVGRARIEPVRIVDEAQHGPPVGELGQERQTGGEDEEALVGAALLKAQRAAESRRLRRGQPLDVIEGRPKQLMQPGERQLRLRLHTAGPQHLHVRGTLARVLEQSRLADPRLAAQHERPALRSACVLEQRPDLDLAPDRARTASSRSYAEQPSRLPRRPPSSACPAASAPAASAN